MTASTPPSSGSETDRSKSTSQSDPDLAQRSRDAKERLQSRYQDIEQTYGDTRARLDEFNEKAVGFIRKNPGVCIVGAVAAGYVIGRLASRRWLT